MINIKTNSYCINDYEDKDLPALMQGNIITVKKGKKDDDAQ